jgi:glyoxylase I family protein
MAETAVEKVFIAYARALQQAQAFEGGLQTIAAWNLPSDRRSDHRGEIRPNRGILLPRLRARIARFPCKAPLFVPSSYGGVAKTPRWITDAARPDNCGNRFERMPTKGIHHVDLAVTDVEDSLAFYRDLLGPLGWTEELRYPSYRGTEEVVYLEIPGSRASFGLRPAEGGEYRYYGVGVEHIAFEVDTREEVDAAHDRCLARGVNVHFPPEEDRDIEGYYALFVFDPDGIRVELFCWPRSES